MAMTCDELPEDVTGGMQGGVEDADPLAHEVQTLPGERWDLTVP